MTNFYLFMLHSIPDWLALIVFTLASFRFVIREHAGRILASTVLLSLFSYMVRGMDLTFLIAPFLQLIFMIVLFKYLFQVKLYYSAVMVSFGYITYLAFQALVTFIYERILHLSLPMILEKFHLVLGAVAISAIPFLIISGFLNKFHIGFIYVPRGRKFRETLPYWLLTAFAGVTIGFYLFFIKENTPVWMLLILGFLQYVFTSFLFGRESRQIINRE